MYSRPSNAKIVYEQRPTLDNRHGSNSNVLLDPLHVLNYGVSRLRALVQAYIKSVQQTPSLGGRRDSPRAPEVQIAREWWERETSAEMVSQCHCFM